MSETMPTADCCPAISLILAIYDRLCVSATSTLTASARLDDLLLRGGAMVGFMLSKDSSHDYVHDLPVGVAMPILELLRVCQAAPSKSWSPEIYDFIGRADLAAQARGDRLESRDKHELVCDKVKTRSSLMIAPR